LILAKAIIILKIGKIRRRTTTYFTDF